MTRVPSETTAEDLREARARLVRMHSESKVGHLGGNLSSIDAMIVTFREVLTARDTFVLSKGHSAGALYTALWSVGRLRDEDLGTFHRDATLLAGHPPASGIDDIPFATGSLGHGLSLAAGTALGLRLRTQTGHVFCLTSDGEWQEGSTWEALIFACHQRLANLTVMIDLNGLQGFGATGDVASMHDLAEKIRAYDLDLVEIDGHDIEQLRGGLALRGDRPQFVVMRTTKGHGIDFMENRMEWHYLPLDAEQTASALEQINAR